MSKPELFKIQSEHFRIGDRVVMQRTPEPEHWRRNEIPNGTTGTVIGKYRYPEARARYRDILDGYAPGVFEKDGVAVIHWDGYDVDPTVKNGVTRVFGIKLPSEYPGFKGSAEDLRRAVLLSRSGEGHIALVDQTEARRRFETEWQIPVEIEQSAMPSAQRAKLKNLERVADLPETKAWELDIITLTDPKISHTNNDRPVHLRVHCINYKLTPRTEMSYMVSWYFDDTGECANMGSVYLSDDHIKEVKRGNVWKHYNGLPTQFSSLNEEVCFAQGMHMAETIRNPETQLTTWKAEEAIDAVRRGLAHGIMGEIGLNDWVGLCRFADEDLGKRVRNQFLRDHGLTA